MTESISILANILSNELIQEIKGLDTQSQNPDTIEVLDVSDTQLLDRDEVISTIEEFFSKMHTQSSSR